MPFDDIFKEIGQFGRYTGLLSALILTITLMSAFNALGQVFFGAHTDHWCATNEWNAVCEEYGYDSELECSLAKRNASVPYSKDGFETCEKYNVSGLTFDPNQIVDSDWDVIKCNDGWDYDTSQYKSTIVTQFDLVCERKNLPKYVQSVYFAGIFLGSIIFGWVGDRFGRRPTMIFTSFSLGILGILSAFSPSFWIYAVLRFFIGAVDIGLCLTYFTCSTEFVGPKWRTVTGIGLWYSFAIGYFVLAGMAYAIRRWDYLTLAISIVISMVAFLTLLMDESPRWLVTVGQMEKAEKIVKKMARINGKKVKDHYQLESDEPAEESKGGSKLMWDVFRIPVLRWRTVNMMYNWFVQSLVYYGLSLSTSSMGVNDYVAFFISGAIEIPAYTASIITMHYLGRRVSTGSFMFVGGIFCLLTIFTPLGPWTLTAAMLGKFGITASFGNVYLITGENFPTPVRSLGIAVCSSASRIGSMLSPFILLLADVWKPLPLLIFGGNSVIAGLLVFLLPETNKKPLPQTIEDAINLGRTDYHAAPTKEDFSQSETKA